MKIVTRDQWGASDARRTSDFGTVQGICVHHTASADTGDMAAMVQAWQRYHMQTKGWYDIAYNFLIDPVGNLYVGRGLTNRGGANGTTSSNKAYLSVAFIGDFTRHQLTGAAGEAFQEFRCQMFLHEYPGAEKLMVHRDFKNTACPGDNLIPLLGGLSLACPVDPPPVPISDGASCESVMAAVEQTMDPVEKVDFMFRYILGRGVENAATYDWWIELVEQQGLVAASELMSRTPEAVGRGFVWT